MDFLSVVDAVLLGLALGITEFLPVSSLGHSLVLSSLLGFPPTKDIRDTLAVFIQGGAVLAVIVYYGRDLLHQAQKLSADPKTRQLWVNILIAFVPVGVLGLVFNKFIKATLFQPIVVGIALVVGGIIFLLIERRKYQPDTHSLEGVSPRQAVIVGLAQITALIPGISRSGATIVGGIFAGLDRSVATLFTFYLFIPTLGAAAGYELFNTFRNKELFDAVKPYMPYFILAAVVAFGISLIAIRWLLRYISTHSFVPFGVYRIIVGAIIIILVVVGKIS